ncbi:glycosyltransferase family 4 protein [Rhodohalobacter sp. SW132]|nr:glycosyltransferase family 4 protein [Rhodohalobacter sp. SW132]
MHPPDGDPMESIGGMQNVSIQLMNTLMEREDVELETILLKTSWRGIGLKTFFFLVSLLWKIPGVSKKFKPDVILFSSMVTAGVLPFMLKKPEAPCVTINHGQDVTLPILPYQIYLPQVFKKLQGVISVSSATRHECIKRGMDPAIGVVLPNGFIKESSGDEIDRTTARQKIEQEFGVDLTDRFLLLNVGRQVKRKGHQWFIENVLDKIKSDVILLLIGEGPETAEILKAKELSRHNAKIVVAGRQPDEILNAAYAAADLFVMPNIPVEGDMEGFGIVLLEANSSGVPAVASNLEGIKDVIEQGVNGYRVPAEDHDQFALKIDKVLNDELSALSERSKQYVTEKFSWDFVISKYLDFLDSVRKR